MGWKRRIRPEKFGGSMSWSGTREPSCSHTLLPRRSSTVETGDDIEVQSRLLGRRDREGQTRGSLGDRRPRGNVSSTSADRDPSSREGGSLPAKSVRPGGRREDGNFRVSEEHVPSNLPIPQNLPRGFKIHSRVPPVAVSYSFASGGKSNLGPGPPIVL